LTTSVGQLAIGSLPSSTITQNVGAGLETFSTAFVPLGRLKGTELIIRQAGSLVKTTKKLKKKK